MFVAMLLAARWFARLASSVRVCISRAGRIDGVMMPKALRRARGFWTYFCLAAGLLAVTYFVITSLSPASQTLSKQPSKQSSGQSNEYPALQVTRNLGKTCDFSEKFELQQLHRSFGVVARAVSRTDGQHGARTEGKATGLLYFTHDDWPQFPEKRYNHPIPESTYDPVYSIQWDFDTAAFLKRPDVEGRPPKLITFVAPMGYLPSIPQPVRMRTCPEMPCRVTTNPELISSSAALIWNLPKMKQSTPPKRTNPDQVFVLHNQERQDPAWMPSYFRDENWRSVFNWTMTYRFDSDILDVYGYLARNPERRAKDYKSILAAKTHMIATFNSHCKTHGRREEYLKMLQNHVPVHVYGQCGDYKCSRSDDAKCLEQMATNYKFYLAFENSICPDYVTEKFFHFLATDMVVVVRGGKGYEKHAPPGTFINADDFKSVEELADYLVFLDLNPFEYVKILMAKDCFVSLFEEYPHRHTVSGKISFMHYHYEAVPMCELCRRLWNLDLYRKTIPDIRVWYDKGNCLEPKDLH